MASKNANEISFNALMHAQKTAHGEMRPWLKIKIFPRDVLDFSTKSLLMQFEVTVENIGRSPATGTWIDAHIWVTPDTHVFPNYETARLKHDFVTDTDGNLLFEDGMVILLSDEESFKRIVGIPVDEIEDALKASHVKSFVRLFGSIKINYKYGASRFYTEKIFSLYSQIDVIDPGVKNFTFEVDKSISAEYLFLAVHKSRAT